MIRHVTKTAALAGIFASALIATACSRQHGQATFDYLKAQMQILEQGRRNMKDHQIPKPPTPPVITKQTKPKERLAQTKEYRESLAQFYTNLIQISWESEKVFTNLQNQLSALNGARVSRKAIASTTLQEQVLGDAAEVEIKLRAWATRAQEDMLKPHARDAMIPHLLLAGIESATGIGGALALREIGKGMTEQAKVNSENAKEKETEQLHLDDSVAALEDARTKLASDIAELRTKRNQLLTTLGAQYPQFTWNSLFEGSSHTAGPANAH
jgi:hypothetical protein